MQNNGYGLSVNITTEKLDACFEDDKYFVFNRESRINWIALAVAYLIGGILATIFNLLFLIAMRRNKSLHKLSNHLLVLLSSTDFIAGSVNMPIIASFMLGRSQGKMFCELRSFTTIIGFCLGSMSFVTVISIALQQYTSVIFPFFHQQNVTLQRIFPIILVHWIVLIAFCTTAWFVEILWPYYQLFVGCFVLLMYSLVIFCYAHVYNVARTARKRITSLETAGTGRSGRRRYHTKAVKTSGTIILAFSICYLPISFGYLWRQINGTSYVERTFVYEWVHVFAALNNFINPLVYYWRLSEVRREVLSICKSSTQAHIMARKPSRTSQRAMTVA